VRIGCVGDSALGVAFDAYGNLLYVAVGVLSPPATKILYTGQQLDLNLLQYYLRARYYVASLGVFAEEDTYSGSVTIPITLHRRLYAADNPLLFVDPSGHELTATELSVSVADGKTVDTAKNASDLSILVKVGTILAVIAILANGFLGEDIYNGEPISFAEAMQQRTQLQEHLAAAAQALEEAKRKVRATGVYTDEEIDRMPIFWVYRNGAGATPEIWQNDFGAMLGVGTKGGVPAPAVLNYGGPGTAAAHRTAALAWAATQGIAAGLFQSLDEYPFASTLEGGPMDWLRVAPVPISEQTQQGIDLNRLDRSQGYKPFTFLVVLVP